MPAETALVLGDKMPDTPSVIYSFIQGPIIASKIEHGDFIRMGVIVPIEKSKYPKQELHPNSYVTPNALDEFGTIEDMLKEDERFANKNLVVRSGSLIYGSSLVIRQTQNRVAKEDRRLEYIRIPLTESLDITVTELSKTLQALAEKNQFVGFELGENSVLSAAIAYSQGSSLPGVELTLLEDVVTGEKFTEGQAKSEEKKAYGLRIEFIMPKDIYSANMIAPAFDRLAEHFGFNKLATIESAYEEFIKLKDTARQRPKRKVVKEVKV